MKKFIITLILLISVLFTNSIVAFAENNIVGTNEANEVLSSDKDIIYEYAAKSLPNKIGVQISEDMISYDRAIGYCNDINLFEKSTLNNDDMREYINNSQIHYEVPVYHNGQTAILIVAKGSEVTEEDRNTFPQDYIEYYESIEGRYNVNGIELWSDGFDNLDYINSLLAENNVTDANIYLVGAAASNLDFIAVVCQGNDEAEFLILDGWDTDDNHINHTNPDSKLYSYKEIKKIAKNYEFNADDIGGGAGYIENNNLQYALIAGGAVLGLCAVALIINFASKKKVKV